MKKQKQFDINLIFIPLMIISFLFFAFGLSNMNNYTYWLKTILILLTTGIVLGNFTYLILDLNIKDLDKYKNSNNVGVNTLLVSCFTFITFGAGIKINEMSDSKVDCQYYTIYEKGENLGIRSRAYYIFIKNNGKKERLSFGKSFYESHQEGERVKLCYVTGYFGFKYFIINN